MLTFRNISELAKLKHNNMALLRYESQVRPPLVEGNKDYHQVTEDICRPVEAKPSRLWWIGFLISVAFLCFGIVSVYHGSYLWYGPVEPE